jgi:hypothetical protein
MLRLMTGPVEDETPICLVMGQATALLQAVTTALIAFGESFKVDRVTHDEDWAWFVTVSPQGAKRVEFLIGPGATVKVTGFSETNESGETITHF